MTNKNALIFIAKQQQPDGSFVIVGKRSETAAPRQICLTLHAFLLDVLRTSDASEAKDIASRLAQYLLNELHPEHFADELSTTDTRAVFHALAALYEHDASLISPDILAASVRFLVANELAPGGPYRNALSDDGTPDVDTNVSICRFIHHVGGPFPKLVDYVEAAGESAVSPYFASRWPRQLMLAAMHQSIDNREEIHLATRPTKFFCKDPNNPSSTYGMPAINDAHAPTHDSSQPKKPTPRAESVPHGAYGRVLTRANAASANNSLLKDRTKTLLVRIAGGDRNQEIGLLATRLAPALTHKPPARQTLETLGAANLYNWIAYTVYDDFLDDGGEPSKLPIANAALRTAVRLFSEAVPNEAFREFVHATFDIVDAANAWELAHCRFEVKSKTIRVGRLPGYGDLRNLYERSLTHSLPLLGTLAAAGVAPSSKEARAAQDAFKQYLVIRQLSDDLRDWQEDLQAGHISYVVARALADAAVPMGEQNFTALVAKIEETFLRQTVPAIGADILARAKRAHHLLAQSGSVKNPNVIDTLIGIYEQNTMRILKEHERVTTFLQAYRPRGTSKA